MNGLDVFRSLATQVMGDSPLLGAVIETMSPTATGAGGKGPGVPMGLNDVSRGIRKGFLRAGRPDLAGMVGTSDFNTWINQESSFNPGAVSEANNQGLRNDGLFQVWRGHDFNANGRFSSLSPRRQARLVADYFPHLDPGDISRYAEQIRGGYYKGWG